MARILAERLLTCPPLTAPPQWAVGRHPDREAIWGLRQEVIAIHERVRAISIALSDIPAPSAEQLESLDTAAIAMAFETTIVAVRSLPYPAKLTTWINDIRVLAARAALHFDQAVSQMQRICMPPFDLAVYCDGIAEARGCLVEVMRDLEKLLAHFDMYLDTEDTRPAPIDDTTWRLGHQTGLSQALYTIKEILYSQPLSLPAGQIQALECAVSERLEQLRLSPRSSPTCLRQFKSATAED
jgi:hypothetical protein